MRSLVRLCFSFTFALTLVVALSSSSRASAATFTVNSLGDAADVTPGDGKCTDASGACTLRAAIQEVNAAGNASSAKEIDFSLPPNSVITLKSALPDVLSTVTITGPGSNNLTIQRNPSEGTPNFRIFTLSVNSAITGLTITNGRGADGGTSSDGKFGVYGTSGGGILNSSNATLRLTDVVVSGNRAGDGGAGTGFGGLGGIGGGILNNGQLILMNSVVTNNRAGNGGAGGSGGNGGNAGGVTGGNSLIIINSTISNNFAGDGGNATPGNPGGTGGRGGGISAGGGEFTITGSTISGNRSGKGGNGGGFNGAQGGDGGGILTQGPLNMVNSTVSNNIAGDGGSGTRGGGLGGYGGGIYNQNFLNITNCTIAENQTQGFFPGLGGGIYNFTGGTVTLKNTLIANNTVPPSGSGQDLSGTFNSQDYNLIKNTSGANINGTTTHNLTGIDPMLGPLQDNGGSTQTHLLLPSSPAIDAGSSGGLTTDQRGLARPFDNPSVPNVADGTDIGAYEAQAPPVAQLQFSASAFPVNEGSGNVTITVARTGDTSGAASVAYRTVDDSTPVRCDVTNGTAFARCDYTTTVGTLTFNAGETSKIFTVPIIDDSYVEDTERFNVQLSNPSGATLGAQATATVTISDNDISSTANPIFNTDFFVRQQYLDFLSREPEAGEPWSSTLNNCAAGDPLCDRISVSANFFRSQEFQLKGLFVFRFYKLALNRMPLYSEIIPDMSSVTGSTTAELIAKKAAYTSAFTQRQEFKNLYDGMTNQQFVDTLMSRYNLQQVTTINPASPDDTTAPRVTLSRSDLVSQLTAGTLTRGQVVRAIADSGEVGAAEFNPAFVAMQYFGYLRRDPDQGGYDAWVRTININQNDFRSMVNGFMNSTEYRLRFGQP